MNGVLDDVGAYLNTAFDQNVKPLYNSLGRKVGYYHSDPELAAGKVYVFTGETLGPPQGWLIGNLLGTKVKAESYLLARGLRPFWMTQAQAQAAVPPSQVVEPPLSVPQIHDVETGASSSAIAAAGISMIQLAVFGVAGFVGLLALRRVLS